MAFYDILLAKQLAGSGGGGGGGGDAWLGMKIATITVTNTLPEGATLNSVEIDGKFYVNGNGSVSYYVPSDSITTYQVPYVEGKRSVLYQAHDPISGLLSGSYDEGSTCSGGVSWDSDDYSWIITGDGSMNIHWIY